MHSLEAASPRFQEPESEPVSESESALRWAWEFWWQQESESGWEASWVPVLLPFPPPCFPEGRIAERKDSKDLPDRLSGQDG